MSEMTKAPVATETTTPEPPKKKGKNIKRQKQIKRIISIVLIAAICGGGIFGMYRFLSASNKNTTVNDATVSIGSITSTVEGNGVAKAKNSSTISLTTAGTVLEVLVNEGDYVTEGQPLFTIDSPAAQTAVTNARKTLEAKQKELNQLMEAADSLTLRAEFSGKLMETTKLNEGENVAAGTVAKLVDDRTLRLEQYYSYAYENSIYVGQTVNVSVPAIMGQLTGKVSEINKVSRVSPEGSKLFQVVVTLKNPGTLTEKMAASATIDAGGTTIYPYEQGSLSYNKTAEIQVKAAGKVISSKLMDYLDVEAGEVLVQIDGEDNSLAVFNAQEALKTAQEELKKAEENIKNLNATAPISGTVLGLAIAPGQEIEPNTTVITISDTSTITITAQVDERNISHVKAGMMVDIDQWGTKYVGTVESVSLTPNTQSGAAFYPATIVVQQGGGDMGMEGDSGTTSNVAVSGPNNTLVPGSTVTYSLVASQSDGCLLLPIQCVKSVSDPETGETIKVVFLKSDTAPEGALEGIDGTSLGIPEGYYPIKVETGISDKQNVEMKSGVSEGDTVFMNTTQEPNYGGGGIMIG